MASAANSPTLQAYGGPGGSELHETQQPGSNVHHLGPLPYTGMDVGFILGVAVILTALGLVLRSLTSVPRPDER